MSTLLAAERTATPYRWRWRVLAVVLLAGVMDLLDSTVMNVAAPSVRAGIGGSEATLQWLAAGYTLAFGVLLVVGGRLGDRWGRRRLFVIGAIGFTLASAACAAAPNPSVLIAARVVQGALGALMIPQGFGVLTGVFGDHERGRAFSLFGPVMGLAGICGPILAGGLIALDLGGLDWRLIFLINLPLGALTVFGALRWMPADPGDPGARIDPVGVALVTAGSALLVYPLIQGRENGWPWWSFAALTAGVLAFALLGRRQRTSPSPILVPSLLGKRAFVGGLVVAVVFFTGLGGLLLVLSLRMQLDLGYSALQAAVALSPVAAGIMLGSLAAARLTRRLGRSILYVGLGVEILGLLGVAGAAVFSAPPLGAVPPMLVTGLGLGLLFGPLIQAVLATAGPSEVGSASGSLNAAQQLATALGVAVAGTLYFGLNGDVAGLVAGVLLAIAACLISAILVPVIPRSLTKGGDR
ncbi:EmrB/QacA subfamily drug resistance transporter [Kibdelosporangium banguiense]|uniref:EmrB/QacA subfamily drug resistance transporter n=1 Tax=Kibdelosporangium banguiense TaxID=1365924 RepID=A0ABS4U0G4_9PSEU|nr:MFS transporter [Kibdelosporangium banguiense]MBP2330148.1 EmrB/QacA subfamily drug resistance transporter [Kibdelosporangium banguiense]